MTPKLKIFRLPHATDLSLPNYETAGAAGMDLRAALLAPFTLDPQARAAISTGLILEIPQDFEGQIRPRSGLALNFGITCLNSPGTIDADYRGEVKVILINHGQSAFEITHGMRIAQLVLSPVIQIEIEEVTALTETPRGAKGFGSTGIK